MHTDGASSPTSTDRDRVKMRSQMYALRILDKPYLGHKTDEGRHPGHRTCRARNLNECQQYPGQRGGGARYDEVSVPDYDQVTPHHNWGSTCAMQCTTCSVGTNGFPHLLLTGACRLPIVPSDAQSGKTRRCGFLFFFLLSSSSCGGSS